MSYQTGIIEALKDWGLVVRETSGWKTRGSPDFSPRGHVCHHDVIGDQEGTHDKVPSIIIDGRSDLPGPLANFWLERDGDVHLVAAGRANHAGSGGWRGLSGNSTVWGTEANSLGTPDDPWPEVQLEAWAKLCAATCEFSGFDPSMVCGHKEWTTRKIDPHTIDMDAFRTQVKLQEKDGLTVADITSLEKKLDRLIEVTINQSTRRIKADLNRERREAERRGEDTQEIVDAIKELDEQDD